MELLDDDHVVGVLPGAVEDGVGRHHVVHHITLRDFLAPFRKKK